jgi:hypothetical protein
MNINMGYVQIINPLRQLSINIPYVGLHFMKNGFFTFSTDDPDQRIDISRLKNILYPCDASHLLPTDADKDGDGLKDSEEDSLWMDYTSDNPDFNGDGVPDGVQIAEELIRLFPRLKEKEDKIHTRISFMPTWGSETCQICGSVHNMGYIQFSNPENNRTYQIPYISLHALAHGSFVHDGTIHAGQRTNPIELYRVMKTHMLFISNDSDDDGLTDAEEAYFGFDPVNPDSDDDGVCDGMEAAIILAEKVRSLPSEPSETEPYAEFLGMDGIQLCSVCGREIPMGVTRIFNPQLQEVSAPLEVSEYAFHFMEKGSFACEGEENNRIDPVLLSKFVGDPVFMHHEVADAIPDDLELKQNYPNPFNPVTHIDYIIHKKTHVSLKVYDIRGREITILVDEVQSPGKKTVKWDGTDVNRQTVNSGFYICTCTAGNLSQSKKMLFLK